MNKYFLKCDVLAFTTPQLLNFTARHARVLLPTGEPPSRERKEGVLVLYRGLERSGRDERKSVCVVGRRCGGSADSGLEKPLCGAILDNTAG